jgi:hypothetical protein
MTPAEQIEAAYNQAMAVIAEYLKPGQRDAEQTLNELIAILDQDDLCDAITEELVNEQVPAVNP